MSTAPNPAKPNVAPEPARLRKLNEPDVVIKRHLRFGWWALLIFLTMGLVLEAFHGFKVAAYLKDSSETRRLMWTLAHAHGTLLGLMNLGFAFTVRVVPEWAARRRGIASVCLRGATILMPAGFFFGGLFFYAGDPGLGILLVPVGGLMLLAGVLLTAQSAALFHLEPRPGGSSIPKRK